MNPIDPGRLTQARSRINEFVFGGPLPGRNPADQPRLAADGVLLASELQARADLLLAHTPRQAVEMCQRIGCTLVNLAAASAHQDRMQFVCSWYSPEVVVCEPAPTEDGAVTLARPH